MASVSQLWPLMPGTQIDPRHSPELADAARRTIDNRGVSLPSPAGQVSGWCASAMARLGEGESALQIVSSFLRHHVQPNMFASSKSEEEDLDLAGSMSVAAGVAEMLLQSHGNEVHFLPALPRAWSSGSFVGFRARGGWTVSMEWHNGRAKQATVTAGICRETILRAPRGQAIKTIFPAPSQSRRIDTARLEILAVQGRTYFISFV